MSLGFIQTTTTMLGVGMATSMTVTNSVVIPHTTETKKPGPQRGSRDGKSASKGLQGPGLGGGGVGGVDLFLGVPECVERPPPMREGFRWPLAHRAGPHWGSCNLHRGLPTVGGRGRGRASSVPSISGCFSRELMQAPPQTPRSNGHAHAPPDLIQVSWT